jgi:hypothetical protein
MPSADDEGAGMACHSLGTPDTPQPSRVPPLPDCPTVSHPIGWEFAVGAGTALIVVVVAYLLARRSWLHQPAADATSRSKSGWASRLEPFVGTKLPAGATFSAKDSWATDLTALIAAIGVVAAAVSDKFPDTVDKRSVLAFSVGIGMLALVATFAPIAYAAFAGTTDAEANGPSPATERNPSGNAFGLLTASFLTLTASFGSLVGILVIVTGARIGVGTKTWIWIACLVGIGLVAVYAGRTLLTLLEAARGKSDFARLSGMVVLTCCGSEDVPRVRIALL